MRVSNLMMASALVLLISLLPPNSLEHVRLGGSLALPVLKPPLNGEERSTGFIAGRYTGASQLMIIADDGIVTYDDSPLGICHVEIMRDSDLKAEFPDKTLGRGKWHTVTLNVSTNEPRTVWTTIIEDDTYKVTAIPYSPRAYVFRLEIKNKDKLIAGAQQFYAIEPK